MWNSPLAVKKKNAVSIDIGYCYSNLVFVGIALPPFPNVLLLKIASPLYALVPPSPQCVPLPFPNVLLWKIAPVPQCVEVQLLPQEGWQLHFNSLGEEGVGDDDWSKKCCCLQ